MHFLLLGASVQWQNAHTTAGDEDFDHEHNNKHAATDDGERVKMK
jgi:hypothetical protein